MQQRQAETEDEPTAPATMATTVLAVAFPSPSPTHCFLPAPRQPLKRCSARLCHAASGNVVASSDAPMLDLLSRPSYKVANATPTVQCKPAASLSPLPPPPENKETFGVWLLNLLCFYLAFLFCLFSAALSFFFLFLYAPFKFFCYR